MDTVLELENTKQRLQAHGIEVLGVTDHHVFKSIYFFDPNGIRLELTVQTGTPAQMAKESLNVHERLQAWSDRKAAWRLENKDPSRSSKLKPEVNDRPELGESH